MLHAGCRALVMMATILTLLTAAHADGDHERARRAVLAGDVMPLARLLDRLRQDVPGEPIEAELEDEHGLLVYEISVLTPEGKLVKVVCDARSGALLRRKVKR